MPSQVKCGLLRFIYPKIIYGCLRVIMICQVACVGFELAGLKIKFVIWRDPLPECFDESFRGEAFTETFDVKIPDNQAPGPAYLLVGSGSLMNQIDFSLLPPDHRTLGQGRAVPQRLRPST